MNRNKRSLCLIGLLSVSLCAPAFAAAPASASLTAYAAAQDTTDAASTPQVGNILTGGQFAIVLSQFLGAQARADAYPNADTSSWYYPYALQMVALGAYPADGSVSLTEPITRGEAYAALAGAFQLTPSDTALSALKGCPDMGSASLRERRAADALIEAGVLSGNGTALSPNDTLTYGQLNNLLGALISQTVSADALPVSSQSAVLVNGASASLSGVTVAYPLILAPSVRDVRLQNVTLQKPLLIRGASMTSMVVSQVTGPLLTLAATDSDLAVSADNGTHFDAITVGDGSGEVSLSGSVCSSLQVTGDRRTIRLTGMTLPSLTISGENCTVIADANTKISQIQITGSGSSLTVNGSAGAIQVDASGVTVDGSGHADSIQTTVSDTKITLAHDSGSSSADDNGLSGITMKFSAPTVAPGGKLTATASFTNVSDEKICSAQWYLDGKAVTGFGNKTFSLSEGQTSVFSQPLTFSYRMIRKHTVGFCVLYQNTTTGKTEKLYQQASVAVQNYPDSHYTQDVLALITPTYRFGNSDYSAAQKTVFVNAKQYSSKTKYLIWVSRSAQKVNVFTGRQKNWSLLHTFDCASGSSATPTPSGVTYITYKQTAWITGTYQCRPVVRFYPSSGYAFHSRLYSPNGKKLIDSRMGKPVSHGCVRMMDEGIYWIYRNVPTGTTVVIY